jgi:hypothetical protein
MLQDLTESVRECLRKAEECRHVAESAPDEQTRSDYLDIERRWLRLAESYQLSDRASRWIDAIRQRGAVADDGGVGTRDSSSASRRRAKASPTRADTRAKAGDR